MFTGSVTTSQLTVEIKGLKAPSGQLASLVALVESYNLAKLGSSLLDKLLSTQRMIDQSKPAQACESLDSFIAQVRAQAGNGGLSTVQSDALSAQATALKMTTCPELRRG
jgi:hypothetical protein